MLKYVITYPNDFVWLTGHLNSQFWVLSPPRPRESLGNWVFSEPALRHVHEGVESSGVSPFQAFLLLC